MHLLVLLVVIHGDWCCSQVLLSLLGQYEFLPHNKLYVKWVEMVCTTKRYQKLMCMNSMFLLTGFDEAEFNMVGIGALLYVKLCSI